MRVGSPSGLVSIGLVAALSGCGPESQAEAGDETGETDGSTEDDIGTDSSTSGDTSGTESSSEDTGDSTDESETTESDTTDTGDLDCPGIGGLAAGDHERMLEHDGLARNYIIHVPPGLDAEQHAPLLLNMHGFLSNAAQQVIWSNMNTISDPRGWITVYPNGTDSSWNAGTCCGLAVSNEVDDIGFLRAVVESVSMEACVDPKRIHATGMSNGGYISHRLACDAADMFASVAPVAGAVGIPDCAPSRPISVLAFHGIQDPLVAYADDATSIDAWVGLDGCDPMPTQVDFDGGNCQTWTGCDEATEVGLCTLDPMGHCWPMGNEPLCFSFFGPYSDAIDANTTMLDFFDAHPMP